MANLTLTIPDDVLRRARLRALERGTSVNAVVREHLIDYVGASDADDVVRALVELSERASAHSGKAGRQWTRDELYTR